MDGVIWKLLRQTGSSVLDDYRAHEGQPVRRRPHRRPWVWHRGDLYMF